MTKLTAGKIVLQQTTLSSAQKIPISISQVNPFEVFFRLS